MAHILPAEANAWLEPTKLTLSSIDAESDRQISDLVIGRLAKVFPNTSSWTANNNTPSMVRTVIAMNYVAWYIDKFYSDDTESNEYAQKLRDYAESYINMLISGDLILAEFPDVSAGVDTPLFFPTDASSANQPSVEFPEDGPPAFTMGQTF